MPNRQYGNKLPLRQYVNTTVYDRIYQRTCLHVDAWLYQTPSDALYFVFLTTAGGQHELSRTMYRATPEGLVRVDYDSDVIRNGIERHVDSTWARRGVAWLNELHRRSVLPTLSQPAEGFKGRSIKLHYVYTDATCVDPLAGIANLYSVTGRAGRDASMTRAQPSPRPASRPAWDAATRSRLRTLDKLLK